MTSESTWTLLTNHAAVLLCIAEEPDLTLRDIADRVGITERAVHRIVTDLANDGYIKVTKVGRRNHYVVRRSASLRQSTASHVRVSELLDVLTSSDDS